MKKCIKCHEMKPATTEFYGKALVNDSGLTGSCKKCLTIANKEWKTKQGSEYGSWVSMKTRCNNKNHSTYKNYGGRGIKVCSRWENSFNEFIKDVGKKPTLGHSIDRVDNDGDYEPGNVKWSTRIEQNNNQRLPKINTKNKSGTSGVTWEVEKELWKVSISRYKKRHHLGYFERLEDAVEARRQGEILHWNKTNTL